MFGTSRLGLTASPAKSVTANRTNPVIASVHRIVRMGRAEDGGAGRGAQAPLGRPHLGQKFPANKVPQRGTASRPDFPGPPTAGTSSRPVCRSGDKIAPGRSRRSGRTAFLPNEGHALFNAAVPAGCVHRGPPLVEKINIRYIGRAASVTSGDRP